jgi:hypothetical protein
VYLFHGAPLSNHIANTIQGTIGIAQQELLFFLPWFLCVYVLLFFWETAPREGNNQRWRRTERCMVIQMVLEEDRGSGYELQQTRKKLVLSSLMT